MDEVHIVPKLLKIFIIRKYMETEYYLLRKRSSKAPHAFAQMKLLSLK